MDYNSSNNTDTEFARLMGLPNREMDLSLAALLITKREHPELDIGRYVRRLKGLGERVRAGLSTDSEPKEVVNAINNVLFFEEGFHGNEDDYYDPRNSHLDYVIDRRMGIPITLSILYIEVARYAGFVVQGVGFPQHFLVKYQSPQETIILDPFSMGLALNEGHLVKRLQVNTGGSVPFRSHYLAAVTKRQIITRVLNNLKSIYVASRDYSRTRIIINMLLEISPWDLDEIRDRGKTSLQLKDYPQALTDLETYLEFNHEATDAFVIQRSIRYIKTLVSSV